MTTAGNGASGSNFFRESVVRFSLFYKQNGVFWFVKTKQLILISKIF